MDRADKIIKRICIAVTVLLSVAACGGIAIGLVPFEIVRERLDRLAGDGSADAYTSQIHGRFQLGAVFFAIVCGLLAILLGGWLMRSDFKGVRLRCVKLGADARAISLQIAKVWRRDCFWLMVLVLIAVSVRLPYVNQPMRYDEAHTYIRYASQPFPLIVTQYDEPNNHILHSLCVHVATQIFGDSPAVVRLPAFVSGVLVSATIFVLARSLFDSTVAASAGISTAVMPCLVCYSVNARGYTITSLLFLIAILAAVYTIRPRSGFAWAAIVLSLSLAVFTVPTMLYGAGMVFSGLGWLVLIDANFRTQWKRLVVAMGATFCLIGLLYLPVLLTYGPDHLLAISRPAAADEANASVSIFDTMHSLFAWCFQGVPLIGIAIFVVSIIVGAAGLLRKYGVLSLLATSLPVVLMVLCGTTVPPERTWCFLVPIMCVVTSVGMVSITRWTSPRFSSLHSAMISTGAIAILITVSTFVAGTVVTSEETGYFPEGRRVVEYLAEVSIPRQPIISVTPSSAVLAYYARRNGMPRDHFMLPGCGHTDDSSAILVTSRRFRQSPESVLAELGLSELFPPSEAKRLTTIENADIYRIDVSAGKPEPGD